MAAAVDLGGWDDDLPAEGGPVLFYPRVDAWVEAYLAPTYRRALGTSRTWCPQWWKHAEAVVRLEGLWRAWEHLRGDPGLGVSVWLRDHADPHMAVLLDPAGPFKGCTPDRHGARLQPLPCQAAPPGLFTDEGSGQVPAGDPPTGGGGCSWLAPVTAPASAV